MEEKNILDLFRAAVGQTEVPEQYFRWACYSLVASAVQDRVWYQQFKWARIYPNLYVFLIGPSGVGKGRLVHIYSGPSHWLRWWKNITMERRYGIVFKVVRNVYGVRWSVVAQPPLTVRYWVDGKKTHAHPKLAKAGYGLSAFSTRAHARQAIRKFGWTGTLKRSRLEIWQVEGYEEILRLPVMGYFYAVHLLNEELKGKYHTIPNGDGWPCETRLFRVMTMVKMVDKYTPGKGVY